MREVGSKPRRWAEGRRSGSRPQRVFVRSGEPGGDRLLREPRRVPEPRLAHRGAPPIVPEQRREHLPQRIGILRIDVRRPGPPASGKTPPRVVTTGVPEKSASTIGSRTPRTARDRARSWRAGTSRRGPPSRRRRGAARDPRDRAPARSSAARPRTASRDRPRRAARRGALERAQHDEEVLPALDGPDREEEHRRERPARRDLPEPRVGDGRPERLVAGLVDDADPLVRHLVQLDEVAARLLAGWRSQSGRAARRSAPSPSRCAGRAAGTAPGSARR